MPELRWTLLILGVVFVAALAWWERRRPHQASRESPHIGGEVRSSGPHDGGWGKDPPWDPEWSQENEPVTRRVTREPTLTLPEIRVRDGTQLPIVEIVDDEAIVGMRADYRGDEVIEGKFASEGESERAPRRFVESYDDRFEDEDLEAESEPAESEPAESEPAESEPVESEPVESPYAGEDAGAGEDAEIIPVVQPEAAEAQRSTEAPAVFEPPIVEWPPEGERRLIALRLVAPSSERFHGRALRQALAAEGFVHGKLQIFHKPDAGNRAVLSAASLTKPGAFDLETMDSQRFVGLNLFAVLPGPRPALKAFEELLATARTLNERLQGALQDERGGPLTPTRIAALREGLESGQGS